MAVSNLGYPYDPELFLINWQNAVDTTLTALYDSGAVQANGTIQRLIENGSDYYTIPFYDVLGGAPDNYDGVANINVTTPTGNSQSGVVYGRAHAWKDQDFIHDFNSGADPLKQITSQVAKFWQKQRQVIMLQLLGGIFSIADDSTDNWDKWQLHVTNIATTGDTVTDANKLGATQVGDAIQKAVGDNSNVFSLIVMHSKPANALAGLNLLNFRKYTDPSGIERQLRIADYNGMTVVVDDGVPVAASGSAAGENEYTSYLLGTGALQYATAPVQNPVELGREELANGGYNYYVTRIRETLHPNGFRYVIPSTGYTKSPTNAQLGAGANWQLIADPKSIAVAKIVSNG